jgi:plastocyanin
MKQAILAAAAALILAVTPAAGHPAATTVHIKMFAFNPASVTIREGDTVTFINDDSDAHTATAVDKSFDSAGLDTGDKWSHTFTKSGTYAYYCALHPYMKGTIVVKAAPANGATK